MDSQTVVRLLLIIVAAFVLFLLVSYYNRNKSRAVTVPEKFYAAPVVNPAQNAPLPYGSSMPVVAGSSMPARGGGSVQVLPSEPLNNEQYRPVEYNTGPKTIKDCYPKDRLTTEDLLPKDAANSKWAQANPAGQGDVKDQNFLTAGYLIGINTIGQSLRNANLQLRSEPPNPQLKVSPWQQSTIEPDVNRRPMELGENC
jgi:hypothetical protein